MAYTWYVSVLVAWERKRVPQKERRLQRWPRHATRADGLKDMRPNQTVTRRATLAQGGHMVILELPHGHNTVDDRQDLGPYSSFVLVAAAAA